MRSVFSKPKSHKNVITWSEFSNHRLKPIVCEVGWKNPLVLIPIVLIQILRLWNPWKLPYFQTVGKDGLIAAQMAWYPRFPVTKSCDWTNVITRPFITISHMLLILFFTPPGCVHWASGAHKIFPFHSPLAQHHAYPQVKVKSPPFTLAWSSDGPGSLVSRTLSHLRMRLPSTRALDCFMQGCFGYTCTTFPNGTFRHKDPVSQLLLQDLTL